MEEEEEEVEEAEEEEALLQRLLCSSCPGPQGVDCLFVASVV